MGWFNALARVRSHDVYMYSRTGQENESKGLEKDLNCLQPVLVQRRMTSICGCQQNKFDQLLGCVASLR